MMFICPVCNGMQMLSVPCPSCCVRMDDAGRIDDYTGPYAPYRPIDDMKMTNGFADLETHRCIHYAVCPRCREIRSVVVTEISRI